ncbi:MAG: hypothetical protein KC646_10125 [Candidatus Cloacimonetes bacterium]|nr:hypothetical protein [Candidatus Cloacimonadota bacterium]
MKCKKGNRVSMTLNDQEYDYLKSRALEEREMSLSGYAKKELFKTLEFPSCQIV